jgi:thiamine-phosphate pyrophosphorylase
MAFPQSVFAKAARQRVWPAAFFLTDAKLGDALWAIVQRLPRSVAVIVRHYDQPDRAAFARRVVQACRRRRLTVLIAGDPKLAHALHADGWHWPEGLARPSRATRPMMQTMAAHGPAALIKARRLGVKAVLVSPVFATSSHPGAPALGAVRYALLVRGAALPVYGLGGLTSQRLRKLPTTGFAAIDAFRT